MNETKPFLSVVITAFNEGKRVSKTLDAVITYLNNQEYSSEIIFVDANSKDNTVACAEKFKGKYPSLQIYINEDDKGKGDGIRFGVNKANGQYILFTDADNSTPIEQVENLLPFFSQGYDVVIGSRYINKGSIKIKQSFARRFVSRCGNLLVRLLIFPGVKDTQCGFKCFSYNAGKEAFGLQTIHGFGFDMEILAIARQLGYKIKEVPVDWYDDPDSTLEVRSASSDSLRSLFEVYRNISNGKYLIPEDKRLNKTEDILGVILAGGFGTRLTPITDDMTKSMVKAANKPILEYTVDLYKKHGIKNIKIGVNYLPFLIEEYFGQGDKWGINISYPIEKDPMGTAGAVKRMLGESSNTIVVSMGDVLTDINLEELIAFHRQSNSKATIALKKVEDTTHFGVVVLDEDGRIKSFQEKPKQEDALSNLANIGVYILEKEVLDLIPVGQPYDFGKQLFPLLLEKDMPFYAKEIKCYWKDIGTLNSLYETNEDVLLGKIPGFYPKGIEEETKGVWVGKNVSIHKNSIIKPPVVIGDNVVIKDLVEIEGPAFIGNGCVIDADVKMKNSMVLDGSYVGLGMSLMNKIVDRHFIIDLNSSTKTYIAENRLLSSVEENKMSHKFYRFYNYVMALFLMILLFPTFVINAIFLRLIMKKKAIIIKEPMVGPIEQINLSGKRKKVIFEMRRYSDEVLFFNRYPRLINVIHGDMNLVGNSPLRLSESKKLTKEYEVQRFKAPVGVVGLYDIVKHSSDTEEEKIVVENYYAVNRSVVKDLIIIWGYILSFFRKR